MRSIELEIQEVKEELNNSKILQQHSFCVHYDAKTKTCMCKNMKVNSVYAPHCKEYITSEQALRKLAEAERQQAVEKFMQMQFKIDIMTHLINAAMIMITDVDKELKESWDKVEKRTPHTPEEERTNAEYVRNRKKLTDAYKKMKYYIQNIDSEYRNYIEHYLNRIFTNKDGTYNVKEWQQYSISGGVMAALAAEFCEVALDNNDNANAVFQFIGGLKRCGILHKRDTEKYLIRK